MEESRKLERITSFEDACDILSGEIKKLKGVNQDIKAAMKLALRSMKRNAENIIEGVV